MNFAQFDLQPSLLKSLQQLGHTKPTPVQIQAIPRVLAGKDIIATAQTGTGKTGAYLLPAIELLSKTTGKKKLPQVLILTPTRELALQVENAALAYGRQSGIQVASVLGGMPYREQLRQLAKPINFIIATPGRLIDHLEQKRVNLSAIQLVVIDEADRMLDMGFFDDVKRIMSATPKKRQTLMFTATMDKRLEGLANTIMHQPERIEILGKKVTLENIEQRMHVADDHHHKSKLLQHVLENESVHKAIIFSSTKRGADELARNLRDKGHRVGALHGDMRQHQRNRTLTQLRTGRIYLLVATDVAARGIDIDGISHVINFELPKFAEDYVHRIGRTGRAGKSGIAISLVSASERPALKRIERFTQHTFRHLNVPGLEPKTRLESEARKPSTRHKKRPLANKHNKPTFQAKPRKFNAKPQRRDTEFLF